MNPSTILFEFTQSRCQPSCDEEAPTEVTVLSVLVQERGGQRFLVLPLMVAHQLILEVVPKGNDIW